MLHEIRNYNQELHRPNILELISKVKVPKGVTLPNKLTLRDIPKSNNKIKGN